MTIRRLVGREILYRKTNFAFGILSVAVAIACLTGASALLRAHDAATERILAERERSTREEMLRMEDDYRLIMRDMGYNVMILPQGQSMTALRVKGHPDTTMPYEHVQLLARGHVATLNHLLPVLQQRVEWPERGMEIILSGTPGQVPVYHRTRFLTPDGESYRDPIMETIPAGEAILGNSVARELGLRKGDKIVLMGDSFSVREVNPPEGTTDDIAVWCGLEWVQNALGLEGRINLILALQCVCHADSLGKIISEVTRILPGVQVVEFSSRVKARAQARGRASEAHRIAIEAEREHRGRMAAAHRRFAAVLVPTVLAGAAVWIFLLFLGNARERKMEVAILRALGVGARTILMVFVVKSVLMGLVGAFLGVPAGHVAGSLWGGISVFSDEFLRLAGVRVFAAALLIAPALSAAAAWLPAMLAARQDPAGILSEE